MSTFKTKEIEVEEFVKKANKNKLDVFLCREGEYSSRMKDFDGQQGLYMHTKLEDVEACKKEYPDFFSKIKCGKFKKAHFVAFQPKVEKKTTPKSENSPSEKKRKASASTTEEPLSKKSRPTAVSEEDSKLFKDAFETLLKSHNKLMKVFEEVLDEERQIIEKAKGIKDDRLSNTIKELNRK
ncbi:hypothetical protein AKO1_011136 [Acrasis kona]|uniref:Uncharacterized protein n=1 Tax=Acrasis kona TaxID=1008807 RepID=A0AAW2YZR0_9EUKA